MKKMNAVIAYGKHDYKYEKVNIPQIGDGELLLKVEACGVCAGDIKRFEGGFRFWGGEGNPPYCEPPFILAMSLLAVLRRSGLDILVISLLVLIYWVRGKTLCFEHFGVSVLVAELFDVFVFRLSML